MTETIYTMRAGKKMDAARIAEAHAAAAEKTALASVVQAQAAAQVAAIQRQEQRDLRAESAEDKAARRAAFRAKWDASLVSVRKRRDFVLVAVVMVASIGTAWPAQMGFYLGLGMHPMLAVLVTAMTEGAAWAGAAMASKAIEDGRPVGMYRAITWGSALTASALNFAHNYHRSIPLACVLALASMLGVVLWEAYAHSQSGDDSGKPSAEVRADYYRKARYPKVSRRARDLIAAVPGIDEGAAWVIAWRSVHGADPGVTHRTLKQHHKAVERIGGLLDKAPAVNPEAVGLKALQPLSATLQDMAPGGTIADAHQAVNDAVVVAFDASYPIEELIGSPIDKQSADESAVRSGCDRDFPDEVPQSKPEISRPTPTARKATGRVPSAAKSTVPKRSAGELLTDARRITAEWPTENLTADRIRKSVRTSAESARTLRDTLRAERTTDDESGAGTASVA
ncbi:hypothetical protein [Yinghuangia soli]|uniref:DUF2637 domain-containing protein n=1 Tax=Yinghuangia soli TaxID=2908204 RepID=A0AA41QB77_9ACTN|nr:hypothetical protein [Yinghuangia soli]MCF2533709.1 hypothetical protein [Yinghuangia soli]